MEKKQKKEKRFVKVYSEGALGSMEIYVDTKTGVNYLFRHAGYAGGMCPLLDADGKPVVSEEYVKNDDFLSYKF